MDSGCAALIADRIRQRGPITAAEFMDLALYAPGAGYYARATRRSGRAGDFYTSVDAGPVFGALLAGRFAALWGGPGEGERPGRCDLVEAGAGNGRLAADVLDAAEARHPSFYQAARVHLVERSAEARAAQARVLGRHAARLAPPSDELPEAIEGILFANELLDALPVHLVETGPAGLVEIHVDLRDGAFTEQRGPLSTPALAAYLADAGVVLQPGWRAEVNLAALAWIADAARRLRRGFLLLVDYGHESDALYSGARPRGTLTSFRGHVALGPESGPAGRPSWLASPGEQDLTAHVDWTSIRRAAERHGLDVVAFESQTRFLMTALEASPLVTELEAPGRLADRLALKTLLMPGGLGSTHQVLLLRKR